MNAGLIPSENDIDCSDILYNLRSIFNAQFADIAPKPRLGRELGSFSERQLKGQLLFWSSFARYFLGPKSDLWMLLSEAFSHFSICEGRQISRAELAIILFELRNDIADHVPKDPAAVSVSVNCGDAVIDVLGGHLYLSEVRKTDQKLISVDELLLTASRQGSILRDYLEDTLRYEAGAIIEKLKALYPEVVASPEYVAKFANSHLRDCLDWYNKEDTFTGAELRHWIHTAFNRPLALVNLVEEVAVVVATLRLNHDRIYSLDYDEPEGAGTKSLKAWDVVRLIDMLRIYKHIDQATMIRYVLWAYPDQSLYQKLIALAHLPAEQDNQLLQATAAIARTLVAR